MLMGGYTYDKEDKYRAGTVIKGRWYGGEYRVIALLGSGGTARVYLVEDIPGGDRYALKPSTDMAGIDREYQIWQRLGPMDYYRRS